MSAYIVSNKTIDCIVKGFGEARLNLIGCNYCDHDGIGQALIDQNYASVNYYYQQNDKAPDYHYTPDYEPIDLVDLYGCIRCYEYQACETPDYFSSDIAYSLDWLVDWITKQLLADAYPDKDIPWGLD